MSGRAGRTAAFSTHSTAAGCTVRCAASIIPMTSEHINAVMAIEQRVFPAPWTGNLFFQELINPGGLQYVATLNEQYGGGVAGYICALPVLDECCIHKLACHPCCQRRGVGGMLLRHLMRQAVDRGTRLFMLEVRESNMAAQLFYRKFRFVQTGSRRGYYTDTQEDALILQCRAADGASGDDAPGTA